MGGSRDEKGTGEGERVWLRPWQENVQQQ